MFKNIKLFVTAFKTGLADINRIDKSIVKFTKTTTLRDAMCSDKALKLETRKMYKFLREHNPRMSPLRTHSLARQMAWSRVDPDAYNEYLQYLVKRANKTD